MSYKLLIILLIFCGLLLAQRGKQEFPWENDGRQKDVIRVPTQYNFSVNYRPPINFNIFFDFDEKSHDYFIRVGTAVLYDLLQFEKAGSAYKARYQISLAVRNEQQTLIKKTWNKILVLDDFKETNAKDRYDIQAFSIPAEGTFLPGQYEGWVEVHDLISRKNFRSKRSFNIPVTTIVAEHSYRHTELAFILDPDSASEYIQVSPALSAIEFGKPYAALMRVLTKKTEPVEINLRLYSEINAAEELYRQEYLTLIPDSGLITLQYSLPTDSMPEGVYKIRVRSEEPAIEMEKSFSVIWFDKPIYLYESDLALQPMRYILTEEEFDLAESLNRDELFKWIHQYWKTKDPTPGTDYNEISTEFFNRVHDANQRFGHKYKKGWQTDRGRILILYGEPQKIENNRYSTNKLPHIIWEYENGQEFVFVDKKNDKDFTLIEKD